MKRTALIILFPALLVSCAEHQYKTYATARPDSTRWALYFDNTFRTMGTGDTLVITRKEKCVSFELRTHDSEIHLELVLERRGGAREILLGDGGTLARGSAADSGAVARVCR